MTQISTDSTLLRSCGLAVLASSLAALPVPGGVGAQGTHVAEGKTAKVTTLWRSERALDQYAKEGLRIVEAVVLASEAPPAEPLHLGLAETCQDLRWLENPELKATDTKRKRRRRKAGKDEAEGPGAPEQPLMIPRLDALDPAGPVVAIAPKIHDRVLFGSGLPPGTRWELAIQTAYETGVPDPLGVAAAGMHQVGFAAQDPLGEPYFSSGWVALQAALRAVGDSEQDQAAALNAFAGDAMEPVRRIYSPLAPMQASLPLVARHALANGQGPAEVLAAEPEWVLEGGSAGRHPYGWHLVASRRSDALVLSTEPRSSEPFTLRTTVVALANDLKAPAQADIVLGDKGGDRYLIALNSREGVYVFKRSAEDASYETVAERKELLIPSARPVQVVAVWKDSTLVLTVGGAELAGIVLPADAMAGSFGMGAHFGCTVMSTGLSFE